MRRIEAEDQPVEETPPRRRAVGEQAVHLRRQPDDGQRLGQRGLALRRLAVDLAPDAVAARRQLRRSKPVPISISRSGGRRPGGDRPGRRCSPSAARRASSASRARRRPRPGASSETASRSWSCRRRWGRSARPLGRGFEAQLRDEQRKSPQAERRHGERARSHRRHPSRSPHECRVSVAKAAIARGSRRSHPHRHQHVESRCRRRRRAARSARRRRPCGTARSRPRSAAAMSRR